MALPARLQLKYWGIATAVFLTLLYLLGDVLLPFVLGSAVAYCLDPIADRLERMGLSRILSVAVISVCFLLLVVLATLLVIPTLVRQAVELAEIVPDLFSDLRTFLTTRFPSLVEEGSSVNEHLAGFGDTLSSKLVDVLNGVLSSAVSLVNVAVLLVIVPVVSFYMLVDWDRMVARVDELLPRDHAPTVRMLAKEMDSTLASFIRGQGTVCLIQGSFYAIALMLAGLNFGLFVGALAGLISFIPYVGALVGGVLAIGLAIFQFWDTPIMIAVVAGIFATGQIVEGNILTPKLVGSSVGLHPVWLLLALSVFGALFGFVGMLVAVPVSAMIGVLVRFLIGQYKNSILYGGYAKQAEDEARAAYSTHKNTDTADQ